MFSPPCWADNEETEGSDVPADYLLGDVEGEEDELYPLDPEHAHREWGLGWGREEAGQKLDPEHIDHESEFRWGAETEAQFHIS